MPTMPLRLRDLMAALVVAVTLMVAGCDKASEPLAVRPDVVAPAAASRPARPAYVRLGQDFGGLPNFGEVTPGLLYRGGQPTEHGIDVLYAQGVRTVVNLRNDVDPEEERWVTQHPGMAYVQIESDYDRPNDPDVRKFLALMAERAKSAAPSTAPAAARPDATAPAAAAAPGAVFVHCYAGQDRTGLYVAAYRIANDGASIDAALKEMDGYGHVTGAFPRLQPFIREHAAAWRAAAAK
jgi:tyrosine-protein phosphatase SIW14